MASAIGLLIATTTVLAGAGQPCPDVNGDGVIGADDIIAVILDWGTDGSQNGGDVDGSGHVDVDDILLVLVGWGSAELFCESDAGLDIDFWYGDYQVFGELGRPQSQVNLLGNVSAANGLAALSFSIDGGPERSLSVGPDQRRLADPGDFNVEILYDEIEPGEHEVAVRAEDLLGNELTRSVTLNVRPEKLVTPPFTIDWSKVGAVTDVVDVVDGRWEQTEGGVRCTDPDYDRLVVLGDVAWRNYEMTVPITVHAIDETGYEWPSLWPTVGVVFRWTGHTDNFNPGAQPRQGWWPLGAAFQYSFRDNACGHRLQLYGNPYELRDEDATCSLTMEPGETYMWKMKVNTAKAGHRYKLKVWHVDEPEPDGWMLTALEPLDQPVRGSIGLLAHHVDVTYGDIRVTPVD